MALKNKKNLMSPEHFRLINEFHAVEDAHYFSTFNKTEGIVLYRPNKPIPLSLKKELLIDTIRKMTVTDCNSIYAHYSRQARESIIGRQTLEERMPKNIEHMKLQKIDLFTYIMSNNYQAHDIETFEKIAENNYKWFLNDVVLEIISQKIVGLWIRKRDITDRKNEKANFQSMSDLMLEQQKIAHIANWEFQFDQNTLIICDELNHIFDIKESETQEHASASWLWERLLEKVDPNDKERIKQAHLNLQKDHLPYTIEYIIETRSGDKKYILEYCKILCASNGRPLRAIGSIQDMSAIKRMQNISIEYKNQFEEMFRLTVDNIFIVEALPKHRYQFIHTNPAFEKACGLSSSQIITGTLKEIFPKTTSSIMRKHFDNCIKQNKAIHFELEIPFASEEKFYSTTLVPIKNVDGKASRIIGISSDITRIKAAERKSTQHNCTLLSLSRAHASILEASTEEELLEFCCESLSSNAEYWPICCVYRKDNVQDDTITIQALSGISKSLLGKYKIEYDLFLGQDTIENAFKTHKYQFEKLHYKISDEHLSQSEWLALNSVFAFPITLHHQVEYVLAIYLSKRYMIEDKDLAIFIELAENIILSIERKRSEVLLESMKVQHEEQSIRLENALKEAIGSLGTAVEFRDPFTAGHQRRVADLAVHIAFEYGLPKERINNLRLAAIIHDIGKITIPAEILSKPTRLNAIEFALIKTHPEIGYQILKNIEFPGPIAEIVRQHHEYLDGSGYPLGLTEDDILLEAKILTVADITEAMISHRPYRPALGMLPTLQEIEAMKGKKLDRKAVDICARLLKQEHYQFPAVDNFNSSISLHLSDKSRSNRDDLN